jgi:hypothetical protein
MWCMISRSIAFKEKYIWAETVLQHELDSKIYEAVLEFVLSDHPTWSSI